MALADTVNMPGLPLPETDGNSIAEAAATDSARDRLLRHMVDTLDRLVELASPANGADECRDILRLLAATSKIYGYPWKEDPSYTIGMLKTEIAERGLQMPGLRSKEAVGKNWRPDRHEFVRLAPNQLGRYPASYLFQSWAMAMGLKASHVKRINAIVAESLTDADTSAEG